MKLIDFGIIFSIVFICIITAWDFKNDMLYRNKMNTVMFNDAVDEIVVDALNMSFYVENDVIHINKEQLLKCYRSELSILSSGTNILKDYYDSNSIFIVTEGDGFYIWSNGQWSAKLFYSIYGSTAQGGVIDSDNRVHIIEATIQENYNVSLSVASGDGESFKNTLSDYSFVAIYYGKEHRIANNKYQILFISGAAIDIK